MSQSFVTQNEASLETRHYVMNATTSKHFFNFYVRKVAEKAVRHKDNFCLVINGSKEFNDAYILPYAIFKEFFSQDYIHAKQNRWVGIVSGNRIKISVENRPTKSRSIGAFYNAFELLDSSLSAVQSTVDVDVSGETVVPSSELQNLIRQFNLKYAAVKPEQRFILSKQVARPNAITDYLKELNNFKCQLCHDIGFKQRNGSTYIETHHIIELHNLIAGSYCSDNIIVVCPTCHRKLHYASINYDRVDNRTVEVKINGSTFSFVRNTITK